MKRIGILNRTLGARLLQLGHGHLVAVVDPGTPLPFDDARVIDLSLLPGIPAFKSVLDALVAELEIEGSTAATEAGPLVASWFEEAGLSPELVTHDALKDLIRASDVIVRTGEQTPYANVVLRCGVPF